MLIEWKDEYKTKIAVIDGQHKNLIDLINKLDASKEKGMTHDFLFEVFRKLIEYTKVHFAFEEKMLQKVQYPGLDKHLKEHAVFVNKLSEFLKDSNKENFDVTNEILKFLQYWFVEHILKNDLEYAKYLKR